MAFFPTKRQIPPGRGPVNIRGPPGRGCARKSRPEAACQGQLPLSRYIGPTRQPREEPACVLAGSQLARRRLGAPGANGKKGGGTKRKRVAARENHQNTLHISSKSATRLSAIRFSGMAFFVATNFSILDDIFASRQLLLALNP